MTDESPNLDSLFLAALEMASLPERAAFLDRSCGEDRELRSQIEKMLNSHERVGSFLASPAPEFSAELPTDSAGEHLAAALVAGLAAAFDEEQAVVVGGAGHSVLKLLGNTIDVPRVVLRESHAEGPDPIARPKSSEIPQERADGRYRLDGEIARGGMGAIIKGRDNDLGRDLAIKVLLDEHKTKPEIVQRFVEEAQIGGQLQHPGIAPVYELGQFSDRRPFFSMKLVKGQTLSKLLSDRKDGTEDRGRFLGIFEQVCQTMAYAHSRGVIHRDLKPANIMVGAFGEVQVMDWGLAKVLAAGGVADEKQARDAHLEKSIIQTRRRGAGSESPGTLGSLGSQTQMGSIMGTPAYMPPEQALGEIDNLDERADVFGLGAILCEILTGKPPYVGTDGTAVFRQASRAKLDDCFVRLDTCGADGELIALTKHCLSPEPNDRPREAGELAGRMSGYLASVETKLLETELNRAAEAARVVEQKKRLRVTLALAASVLAVLACGVVASTWQAVRAMEAENLAKARLAEVAAERDAKDLARGEAEAILTFLTQVFQSPDPQRDGRTITVAETLDRAAQKLETDLSTQPDRRVRLRAALGNTYDALGLSREAIPLLENARDYHLATSGPEHPNTLMAMQDLAMSYVTVGRWDEAIELCEKVLLVLRKNLGPEHDDTVRAMHDLANAYHKKVDRQNEALRLREDVLPRLRKVLGPEAPPTLSAMHNLANSYDVTGRQDEALRLREELLPLRRKVNGPEHPDTLLAMDGLADSYKVAGRQDEALVLREEVLALHRKVNGAEHPKTLWAMHNLADSYEVSNRRNEALLLREEVLTLRRKVDGAEHSNTLAAMSSLEASYRNAGRSDKAIKLGEELLPLRRKVDGAEHRHTLAAMHNLAIAYYLSGQLDEALRLREEVLPLRLKLNGTQHRDTLLAMNSLANSYDKAGRLDEALKLRHEAISVCSKLNPPEHADSLMVISSLALTYHYAGRFDEALKLREEALPRYHKILGPKHPETLKQMDNLATSYEGAGRRDEAFKLREEAVAIRRKVFSVEHSTTLDSMHNLANSYFDAGRKDEALRLREEVLPLRRKVNGPEHEDTLKGMESLASSYLDVGRDAEALALREEAFPLLKARIGPDRLETLAAQTNLAVHYREAGRESEGLPLLEDSFERKLRVLPANHLYLFVAASNLSEWYAALDRGAEATAAADLYLRHIDGMEGVQADWVYKVLVNRNRHLVESGDAAGCRATAERWEKHGPKAAGELYNACRFRAVAAAVQSKIETDESARQAKEDADLAMAWLQKAVAAGYENVTDMEKDPDLDALRNREDFKLLMAELAANTPTVKPQE